MDEGGGPQWCFCIGSVQRKERPEEVIVKSCLESFPRTTQELVNSAWYLPRGQHRLLESDTTKDFSLGIANTTRCRQETMVQDRVGMCSDDGGLEMQVREDG